jgi:hypothetical protein
MEHWALVICTGWSGIFSVGTAAGPRTVIARADSFTGPPRVAMPFNLENDDAESVESVRATRIWICVLLQPAGGGMLHAIPAQDLLDQSQAGCVCKIKAEWTGSSRKAYRSASPGPQESGS